MLEQLAVKVWNAGDVSRLASYMADDYCGTTASGKVVDKAGLLRFVSSAPDEQSRYDDETAWVHGDVGVYRAKVTDTWIDARSGQKKTAVTRVTDVWVRSGTTWKIEFSQETTSAP